MFLLKAIDIVKERSRFPRKRERSTEIIPANGPPIELQPADSWNPAPAHSRTEPSTGRSPKQMKMHGGNKPTCAEDAGTLKEKVMKLEEDVARRSEEVSLLKRRLLILKSDREQKGAGTNLPNIAPTSLMHMLFIALLENLMLISR